MYFSCNCTGNWKNVYCTETVTACDVEHECADGATCLPRVPNGYHCLCPLGRRGELCYEGKAQLDIKSSFKMTVFYVGYKCVNNGVCKISLFLYQLIKRLMRHNSAV